MNMFPLGNTFLGYGSSSESEEDDSQSEESQDSEQEREHNSPRKKRKLIPKAQQYMHLLEEDFDDLQEEQEQLNKRRRIGTGSSVLENLPPPENIITNTSPNVNFGREAEFVEFDDRDDGPNLKPIQFKVQAAADESDVEVEEGIITKYNLLENEMAGIGGEDDVNADRDDWGSDQKNLQFSGDSRLSKELYREKKSDAAQVEGLPKDVQEHLSQLEGNVKISEIKAEDIRDTGPGGGANEHDPIVALGQEYALNQRALAGNAPSRVARRKHQIGSLLHDARMNEMEFLLKESQGKKSKAETEAKYGWR